MKTTTPKSAFPIRRGSWELPNRGWGNFNSEDARTIQGLTTIWCKVKGIGDQRRGLIMRAPSGTAEKKFEEAQRMVMKIFSKAQGAPPPLPPTPPPPWLLKPQSRVCTPSQSPPPKRRKSEAAGSGRICIAGKPSFHHSYL